MGHFNQFQFCFVVVIVNRVIFYDNLTNFDFVLIVVIIITLFYVIV